MPDTIAKMGISREDFEAVLEEMVEAALADATTAGNPRVPTADDVRKVFWTAYYGK
jgi:alcohol dehydrogenase class IV